MAKTKEKTKADKTKTNKELNTLKDLQKYLNKQAQSVLIMVKESQAIADKIREIENVLRKFDDKQGTSYTDAYSKHLDDMGVITRLQADDYIKQQVEEGAGVVYMARLLQDLRREYAGDSYLRLTEYDTLEHVKSIHLWNALDTLLKGVTAVLDGIIDDIEVISVESTIVDGTNVEIDTSE